MPWFKVDDALHAHPKARAAGLPAMGLWAMAGSYCMSYKTDGAVPAWFVTGWPQGKRLAAELVSARLWECTDGGYQFHDWADFQPTAEEIEAEREKSRERQRARRQRIRAGRSAGVTPPVTRDVPRDVTRESRSPVPSRPVPALPVTSGGADEPPAATAQTYVAEWLDGQRQRPPSDVIGQVSKRLKVLVDDGIEPEAIRRGLAEWADKRLHPSALPSVVHDAQKATANNVVQLPDGRLKLPPMPPTSPFGPS